MLKSDLNAAGQEEAAWKEIGKPVKETGTDVDYSGWVLIHSAPFRFVCG
jgi:hypothetical protein